MANQYVSKVVLGSETLIDLTADTITADKVLSGYTAHGANGAEITGTCTFDANTQDATAAVAEVLTTKTFYKAGTKMTGTMPNIGKQTSTISTKTQSVTISQGYHDGSGSVSISSTEQAKIIAGNIKQGVEILGVTGTLEPSSSVTAQSKTATPSLSAQTILPDSNYDYLSQVTVEAIPVTRTDNASGGVTVTIAA
jgi:hypothetical protein